MTRIIQQIRPTIPKFIPLKRVAAYARVSSSKDAMLQSLSAQISYYNDLIQKNPYWIFSGIYADEGITGTKDNRAEFQRMLSDCRAGRIEMIITKSISRFARNTVTLLEAVRELKDKNIDIFFEKENIHSISGDGELMLTILASFAQEESRSVSDNCKWRIRKRFKDGELVNLRFMYGYQVSKGEMEIDPYQASIVRMIFNDYVSGFGCDTIAKKLRGMELASIRDGIWTPKRVADILKNEKYTGNSLLQKKFVADHLTKYLKRNDDDLPQYYAEDTHDAIVDLATFERVQTIMAERRTRNNVQAYSANRYPFSGVLVCAQCGKTYKRITHRGTHGWDCSTYRKLGRDACRRYPVSEITLQAITSEVLGQGDITRSLIQARLKQIIVHESGKLEFAFQSGQKIERNCQIKSDQKKIAQPEVQ